MTTTVHTIDEAAEILHCSARSVHRMVTSGALRAFRVGKRGWRITSDALEQYMAGTQVAS